MNNILCKGIAAHIKLESIVYHLFIIRIKSLGLYSAITANGCSTTPLIETLNNKLLIERVQY